MHALEQKARPGNEFEKDNMADNYLRVIFSDSFSILGHFMPVVVGLTSVSIGRADACACKLYWTLIFRPSSGSEVPGLKYL